MAGTKLKNSRGSHLCFPPYCGFQIIFLKKNLNKRSFLLEYCEVIFSLAKAWLQSRSALPFRFCFKRLKSLKLTFLPLLSPSSEQIKCKYNKLSKKCTFYSTLLITVIKTVNAINSHYSASFPMVAMHELIHAHCLRVFGYRYWTLPTNSYPTSSQLLD